MGKGKADPIEIEALSELVPFQRNAKWDENRYSRVFTLTKDQLYRSQIEIAVEAPG